MITVTGGANVVTSGNYPAMETSEALAKQEKAFKSMRIMAKVHGVLGVISLVSSIGGLVVGAMAINVTYPVVDGMPLFATILVLLSGFCAYKISICKPETDVKGSTKCYVILHYVICLLNVTIAFIAGIFSGWAIAICNIQTIIYDGACEPNYELIMTFCVIRLITFLVIAISNIFGLVLFCLYARVFGFTNRRERVNQLERRVANLQSQIDRADNPQPPPPYNSLGYKL